MSNNEALDVLIEDTEASSPDSAEVYRHIIHEGGDTMTEEEQALFNIQAGLEQQEEGSGMVKRGRVVLQQLATRILQNHNGPERPKQLAFVGKGYTAWINVRPNGYSKLSPGMIKELKEISPNVEDHIKVTTSISVKWGSIPNDKQKEVAKYLVGINNIVYGEDWCKPDEDGNRPKPPKGQPSLVLATQEKKAKTDSFYSHQFNLAKDAVKKFQDKMPLKFALSSQNGRKK